MHLRRDALAAAAEWISAVESLGRPRQNRGPGRHGGQDCGRAECRQRDCRVGSNLSLDVRHMQRRMREVAVTHRLRRRQAAIAERNADIAVEW